LIEQCGVFLEVTVEIDEVEDDDDDIMIIIIE